MPRRARPGCLGYLAREQTCWPARSEASFLVRWPCQSMSGLRCGLIQSNAWRLVKIGAWPHPGLSMLKRARAGDPGDDFYIAGTSHRLDLGLLPDVVAAATLVGGIEAAGVR
jgi:hypothetical protein